MGGRRRGGRGAITTVEVKFDFWSSMGDLVRLVMRSRAQGLKSRLLAALGLVLVGKWTGVYAPLLLGKAVNALARGHGPTASLNVTFFSLVAGYVALRFRSEEGRVGKECRS